MQTKSKRGCGITALTAALVVAFSLTARAQTNSNQASVALSATVASSLTVNVGVSSVTFGNLSATSASTGSSPIPILTKTNLTSAAAANLTTYAYFADPTAALTNGGSGRIPSSVVFGTVGSGTATPFTGSSPFAGASSLQIQTTALPASGTTNVNNSLALKIDVTSNAAFATVSPGQYTGTLFIVAQAI